MGRHMRSLRAQLDPAVPARPPLLGTQPEFTASASGPPPQESGRCELEYEGEEGCEYDKVELREELVSFDGGDNLVCEERRDEEGRQLVGNGHGGGGDELCIV